MNRSCLALVLVVVGLNVLTHAPFMGGGLLTDDFIHLYRLEQHPSLPTILSSPDAFGFYRPVAQTSLRLDTWLWGMSPVAFRATNLLLHLSVIVVAFAVAHTLLQSVRAAFLATLAFALTPKAHPIVVLWVSARPELLMALFSLLAVLCWTRWDRGGRAWWLGATCVGYGLALLSKESAVLLPMLLVATPYGSRTLRPRLIAAAGMAVIAACLLVVRAKVGALMPTSLDAHYNLMTPIERWARNARNYLFRALPAPAVLLGVVGLPAWARSRGSVPGAPTVRPAPGPALLPLTLYATMWFVAFILPVLPVVARSELYLYLPGFGLCLLAGSVVDRVARQSPRVIIGTVMLYALALGGYQASRSLVIHRDLTFSARLVDALAADEVTSSHRGALLLVPLDRVTAQYLRDSIGGYLNVVLKLTLGRGDIRAAVAYPDERPAIDQARRIGCIYRDGTVVLRADPPPNTSAM